MPCEYFSSPAGALHVAETWGYPAPPMRPRDMGVRPSIVALADAFCDQRCSPLVRDAIAGRVEARISENEITIVRPPGQLILNQGRIVLSGSALRLR